VELYKLIMPLGIATYVCLFLTVASGVLIFKYHLRWIGIKAHICLGFATLILGSLHAGIVIYLNR